MDCWRIRMKHLMHTSLMTALVGFSSLALAAPAPVLTEIVSQKTDITVAGQSYATTFNPTSFSLSDFTGLEVSFDIQGDYNYYQNESLNFKLDGGLYEFTLDLNSAQTVQAINTTLIGPGNYYHLTGTYNITGSEWDAIAADNQLNIAWFNAPNVGNIETEEGNNPYFNSQGDFVSYSIAGIATAVPEPSTYALMLTGLGLVGFMASRRRKFKFKL